MNAHHIISRMISSWPVRKDKFEDLSEQEDPEIPVYIGAYYSQLSAMVGVCPDRAS